MAHRNWKYLAAGLVRRHVPQAALFALMRMQGRHNSSENDPERAFAILRDRLERAGIDIAGKHILEFGSGRTARLGVQMLAAGACAVTQVDLYAIPVNEPQHRALLENDCTRLGLNIETILSKLTVIRGDFLSLEKPQPAAAVDLVLSNAVLEHVRDPASIFRTSYAWLRPGGWTFHVIDLRDHNLGFRYPFEMLTYSPQVWDRWLDLHGGFHLNRWRASQYLQAITDAEFVQVGYSVNREDAAALEQIRPRLHPSFRDMDPQSLAILGIDLFGRKPHVLEIGQQ